MTRNTQVFTDYYNNQKIREHPCNPCHLRSSYCLVFAYEFYHPTFLFRTHSLFECYFISNNIILQKTV